MALFGDPRTTCVQVERVEFEHKSSTLSFHGRDAFCMVLVYGTSRRSQVYSVPVQNEGFHVFKEPRNPI